MGMGLPWQAGLGLLAQANPRGALSSVLCYTGRMFIHRIHITGCSDRGAWPWRSGVATSAQL